MREAPPMIHELFRASSSASPAKTAVVADGARLSYAQLRAEARRLAGMLRATGALPGDRVAVLLPNSLEAAVSIWAVFEAGGVLVPLHATARRESLAAVVENADPRWLVTSGSLAAAAGALRAEAPGIERVFVWRSEADTAVDDSLSMAIRSAWSAAGSSDPAVVDDRSASLEGTPRDPAAIIYTSGSTGEPRGALLTHANMRAALAAVHAYLGLHAGDTLYSALPLSSSYGLYQLLSGLALGATVVLDRSFSFPARSLALVAQERATVFAGVPTMYAWLARSPVVEQYDLSSLRILTSAAASLPVEHGRRVRERLPQARLFVMYGQTECKRASYLDPDEFERRPGSVGRGMPLQEHAVIDEEGRPVQPGETGELVVRGPHVMQGYWRNPEATAQKLRPRSGSGAPWLHTGDLFRVDEAGYLYFVGRRDEVLKIGGHKVSPREVEEVICTMPQVREAAVIGIPDESWGQAVAAHVVPAEGESLDPQEVIRYCSQRLPGYMVPKRVRCAAALPKTESGKIKKRELPA